MQEQIRVYGDSAVVSGHMRMDVLIDDVPTLVDQPLSQPMGEGDEGLAEGRVTGDPDSGVGAANQ